MSTLTLSPQRLAELEQFAREHGQTAEDVLDEAVSSYLDWQTSAFETDEAQYAADLDEAFEDLKAERWVTLEAFDLEMRQKHGIPR